MEQACELNVCIWLVSLPLMFCPPNPRQLWKQFNIHRKRHSPNKVLQFARMCTKEGLCLRFYWCFNDKGCTDNHRRPVRPFPFYQAVKCHLGRLVQTALCNAIGRPSLLHGCTGNLKPPTSSTELEPVLNMAMADGASKHEYGISFKFFS